MIFDEEIFKLSVELKRYFSKYGITLAGAESCTGGLIGGAITEVSGSSDYFLGSAVTYSNKAKRGLLGVSEKTLDIDGPVSLNCASEMSKGARYLYSSDLAFSVTGVAGPEGGTKESPVGTVWFGFSGPSGTSTFSRCFPGDRSAVRLATVTEVLRVLPLLYKELTC